MDELVKVEMLSNDSMLFEKEFGELKNFYHIDSINEVHDFIKLHPGIILILNSFKPLLKRYFADAVFELKFAPDLSGTWFDLLELNIWVDEYTFYNGSADYIDLIDRRFRPLRKRLGLVGEILLSKRILNENNNFSMAK